MNRDMSKPDSSESEPTRQPDTVGGQFPTLNVPASLLPSAWIEDVELSLSPRKSPEQLAHERAIRSAAVPPPPGGGATPSFPAPFGEPGHSSSKSDRGS